MKLQLRRDTDAAWTASNPVLLVGEPGFATDTGILKIGNGVDAWTDLSGISGAGDGYELELLTEATPANIVCWGGSVGEWWNPDTLVNDVEKMYEANFDSLTTEEKARFMRGSCEVILTVPTHEYPEKGYYLEIEFSPKNILGTLTDEFGNTLTSDFVASSTWHSLFLNEVSQEFPNPPAELNGDNVNYDHYGSWEHAPTYYKYFAMGTPGTAGKDTPEAWSDNGGSGKQETSYIEHGMEGSRQIRTWHIGATKLVFKAHITRNPVAPGLHVEFESRCYAMERPALGEAFAEHLASNILGNALSKTYSDTLDRLLFIFYTKDSMVNHQTAWDAPESYNFQSPTDVKNPANWHAFSIKLYAKI